MYVAQKRWREVQAPRRNRDGRLPAGRAFGDTLIHQSLDAFKLHARDDGANINGFIEWRTDAQRVHAVLNLADEFLRDAFLHQQARARATNLPLIEPDAVDQPLDCAVEIRVFKKNERRLAAKLKRKLLVALRRGLADSAAYFRGTRERDLVDVGMFNERFAGRAIAREDIDDSARQFNLPVNMCERPRGQR